MPTTTWKSVERKIAAFWPGAKRRGADYGDKDGGKSDVICPGWSIEIKHRSGKMPSMSLAVAAIFQAQKAKENQDDIAVAVIHPAGWPYKDSIVCMSLEDFAAHFINHCTET